MYEYIMGILSTLVCECFPFCQTKQEYDPKQFKSVLQIKRDMIIKRVA